MKPLPPFVFDSNGPRIVLAMVATLLAAGSGCGSPVEEEPVAVPDAMGSPTRDAGTVDVTPAVVLPPQPKTVPVVLIEASAVIPNEPKIDGRFRLLEDTAGLVDPNADAEQFDGRTFTVDAPIGIEVRGRSTSNVKVWKKSYGIELRDGQGKAAAHPLLGMPKESDWVLYACFYDRTCLRNALAYTLARQMEGTWHPRFQFVEVFVDGKYAGLYNLIERIKRDKNRIDVGDPKNDVTGGYIFHLEVYGKGGIRDFAPNHDLPLPKDIYNRKGVPRWLNVWVYHSPKAEEMQAGPARDYLHDYVKRFEIMMNGDAWRDPVNGYPAQIDVASFVDVVIMRELARDVDAYRLSTYFHKQSDARGGKLVAGPVWDFDRTFGNADYYEGTNPEGWSWTDMPRATDKTLSRWEHPPQFFAKILSDEPFMKRVACRWKALRAGPFATSRIEGLLDGWVEHIAEAQRREAGTALTTIAKDADSKVAPRAESWEGEVAYLRNWVGVRSGWLDRTLAPLCP